MNLFILLKQQHREELDDATCGPFKYSNSVCVCEHSSRDLVMQMHPEAVRLLIRATSSDDATRARIGAMAEQQLNRIRNVYSIECCSYLIHNAPLSLSVCALCV